jgi:hypothetical protein
MICRHLRRSRLAKILNVFREYASSFFEPAASHPPAAPSPRYEGLLGQAPSSMLKTSGSFLWLHVRAVECIVRQQRFSAAR